jgi:hypothetical protein
MNVQDKLLEKVGSRYVSVDARMTEGTVSLACVVRSAHCVPLARASTDRTRISFHGRKAVGAIRRNQNSPRGSVGSRKTLWDRMIGGQ